MRAIISNLEKIVHNYSGRLNAVTEDAYLYKPAPGKWSKKEILGHLVDSAQNNIRRFVVPLYEEIPTIVYDQDKWVEAAGYQDYPTKDLISLWILLNKHICLVLARIPEAMAQRQCNTRSLHPQTIDWLAADYCNHLLHHLHQILDMDPIAYP